jgi:hypothetical protein
VEYDLDNDDEDWLEKYNQGQSRLASEKLERMLWKLEVSCADATDRVLTTAGGQQLQGEAMCGRREGGGGAAGAGAAEGLDRPGGSAAAARRTALHRAGKAAAVASTRCYAAARPWQASSLSLCTAGPHQPRPTRWAPHPPNPAGASLAEKMSASTCAVIDHLPKADALAMLRKCVGGREAMLHTVYDYWASKRKRTGKPMMRRLQAPTPANDTNPYNVFRSAAPAPSGRARLELLPAPAWLWSRTDAASAA